MNQQEEEGGREVGKSDGGRKDRAGQDEGEGRRGVQLQLQG